MEKVFEIYIRTTPERLWAAITDPQTRARFQFGATIESDWSPESAYRIVHADAPGPLVDGTNIEIDPPRRLLQSFHAHWSEGADAAGTSRVTWEIEPVGDSCRLTVVHDQLPSDAAPDLYGGWPMLLSGLKRWLERPGPPAMDEITAAQVRELVATGAVGGCSASPPTTPTQPG